MHSTNERPPVPSSRGWDPRGWDPPVFFFIAIVLMVAVVALFFVLRIEWPIWILGPLAVLCSIAGLLRGVAIMNRDHDKTKRR